MHVMKKKDKCQAMCKGIGWLYWVRSTLQRKDCTVRGIYKETSVAGVEGVGKRVTEGSSQTL